MRIDERDEEETPGVVGGMEPPTDRVRRRLRGSATVTASPDPLSPDAPILPISGRAEDAPDTDFGGPGVGDIVAGGMDALQAALAKRQTPEPEQLPEASTLPPEYADREREPVPAPPGPPEELTGFSETVPAPPDAAQEAVTAKSPRDLVRERLLSAGSGGETGEKDEGPPPSWAFRLAEDIAKAGSGKRSDYAPADAIDKSYEARQALKKRLASDERFRSMFPKLASGLGPGATREEIEKAHAMDALSTRSAREGKLADAKAKFSDAQAKLAEAKAKGGTDKMELDRLNANVNKALAELRLEMEPEKLALAREAEVGRNERAEADRRSREQIANTNRIAAEAARIAGREFQREMAKVKEDASAKRHFIDKTVGDNISALESALTEIEPLIADQSWIAGAPDLGEGFAIQAGRAPVLGSILGGAETRALDPSTQTYMQNMETIKAIERYMRTGAAANIPEMKQLTTELGADVFSDPRLFIAALPRIARTINDIKTKYGKVLSPEAVKQLGGITEPAVDRLAARNAPVAESGTIESLAAPLAPLGRAPVPGPNEGATPQGAAADPVGSTRVINGVTWRKGADGWRRVP